jgi:hypothetical protein
MSIGTTKAEKSGRLRFQHHTKFVLSNITLLRIYGAVTVYEQRSDAKSWDLLHSLIYNVKVIYIYLFCNLFFLNIMFYDGPDTWECFDESYHRAQK